MYVLTTAPVMTTAKPKEAVKDNMCIKIKRVFLNQVLILQIQDDTTHKNSFFKWRASKLHLICRDKICTHGLLIWKNTTGSCFTNYWNLLSRMLILVVRSVILAVVVLAVG